MIGRHGKLGLGAHVFIFLIFDSFVLYILDAVHYGPEIFMATCHIYLPPPLPPFYRRLRFHKWPLGWERKGEASVRIYFMTLFCISSAFFVPHSKLVWERKITVLQSYPLPWLYDTGKLLSCMIAFFLFPFLWDFVSSQAEAKRDRVRCPEAAQWKPTVS